MDIQKLIIRRLTIRELHKFGIIGAFENDSAIIWPSNHEYISNYLSGRRSIVIAAMHADGPPVSWASFGSNRLDPSIWTYGNLFTKVDYRGRGIAQDVVDVGFRFIRRAGGKRVYCFVDATNNASLKTHSKLGFCETGLIKTIFDNERSLSAEITSRKLLRPLCRRDMKKCVSDQLYSHANSHWEQDSRFVLKFLVADRPIKPWKHSPHSMGCFVSEDKNLVFVRTGREFSNIFTIYNGINAGKNAIILQSILQEIEQHVGKSYIMFHNYADIAQIIECTKENYIIFSFDI